MSDIDYISFGNRYLRSGKSIRKAEFDAAINKRFVKFAGRSYRETTSSEDFPTDTNNRLIFWKSVQEFARPQASRTFFEFDSPSFKSRHETIRIDGKIYLRKEGGEWTENSAAGEVEKKSSPERKFETVEEQTEYKSLGTKVLNNLNASVYEKLVRKKMVNESEKREVFSTLATTYWLDAEGGILKEVTLTENRVTSEKNPSGMTFRNQRTTVWELDPNIRIEAPVPAKQL